MSALNLRLPDSIHRHIKEIAKQDGVSIKLFITLNSIPTMEVTLLPRQVLSYNPQ